MIRSQAKKEVRIAAAVETEWKRIEEEAKIKAKSTNRGKG